MSKQRQEICVIGAGVVGASIAFNLARREGTAVSIIDAGYPGAGTTDAGTGWLTARGTGNADYRELRLAAMEEHRRLSSLFASAPMWNSNGILQTEDASDRFDAMLDECRMTGFSVEVLSAAQVNARLEPHVAFANADQRVAFFPDDLTVAGALLTRTLVETAIESGAVGHFGARVVALEPRASGRHGVVFEDGTVLECDVVVNAAGARADRVAAMYDVAMPMSPQPGLGLRVRAEGNPLSRMLHMRTLAAKPETDGVIRLRGMAGWKTGAGSASPDGNFTGGAERGAFISHLVNEAQRLLPSANIRPISALAGVRPIPADGLPRVGEVASRPGYYEAVMHSGAVLGPLIGRLLTDEIVKGSLSPLLEPFRPARFLTPLVEQGSSASPSARAAAY